MITAENLQNKKISLNENNEIARGGEGRIILITKTGKEVAKVFHKPLLLSLQPHFEFLMNLSSELFLSPKDLLFKKNHIIGYVMPLLPPENVPISSLFGQNFCKKNRIELSHKLQLIEQLGEAIKQAHKNKIVIGDLNPYNIMVNIKDFSLKIIDTDSFETPFRKHTGLLLEDIRDYQKRGEINQQSDYFAFSVIVFNLLSFAHPFKGIHPKFKSLKDRMINRLPIFKEGIKRPKCYFPPLDSVKDLFVEFYVDEKRYFPNFTNLLKGKFVQTKAGETILADQLNVQTVLESNILMADFNQNFGFVKTDTDWLIYEQIEKSKIVLRQSYAQETFDQLFLADYSVIGVKGNEWFYEIHKSTLKIKNLDINSQNAMVNYEGLLAIISDGAFFKVFLNEIRYQNAKMERVEVFVEGFKASESFIQNAGGVQNVFYNSGNNLSTIRLDKRILSLNQNKDYAFISYKEKNQIKHEFITFNKLKTKSYNEKFQELNGFTVQKMEKGADVLFFCKDNCIELRESENLNILTKFSFNGVSSQSEIYSSKAGLIILENNLLYLVNKK